MTAAYQLTLDMQRLRERAAGYRSAGERGLSAKATQVAISFAQAARDLQELEEAERDGQA